MTKFELVVTWIISISLAELFFGIIYAWFIYYRPIERTYISVAIGTSIIALACSLIIGGTLYIYGLLGQFWCLPYTPWLTLGLAGGPMAISQEIKFRKIRSRTKEIVDVWQEYH